jgi:predicted XRE-type DNA-binding protein
MSIYTMPFGLGSFFLHVSLPQNVVCCEHSNAQNRSLISRLQRIAMSTRRNNRGSKSPMLSHHEPSRHVVVENAERGADEKTLKRKYTDEPSVYEVSGVLSARQALMSSLRHRPRDVHFARQKFKQFQTAEQLNQHRSEIAAFMDDAIQISIESYPISPNSIDGSDKSRLSFLRDRMFRRVDCSEIQ